MQITFENNLIVLAPLRAFSTVVLNRDSIEVKADGTITGITGVTNRRISAFLPYVTEQFPGGMKATNWIFDLNDQQKAEEAEKIEKLRKALRDSDETSLLVKLDWGGKDPRLSSFGREVLAMLGDESAVILQKELVAAGRLFKDHIEFDHYNATVKGAVRAYLDREGVEQPPLEYHEALSKWCHDVVYGGVVSPTLPTK